MLKYKLDKEKLMETLVTKKEEIRIRYTYTKADGNLDKTWISVYFNGSHIIFVRTLGYVELDAFPISEEKEVTRFLSKINKIIEQYFDFECNKPNIIGGYIAS